MLAGGGRARREAGLAATAALVMVIAVSIPLGRTFANALKSG